MDNRKYEVVFIARQDLSQAQVDTLTATFSQVLTDLSGQIHHTEYCGLKSFAYRIRKNKKGHYVLMDILAPAKALHEMERIMSLNEDVLRFLTVKVDEFGSRPSAFQSRYTKDDRGFSPREDRDDQNNKGAPDASQPTQN